MHLDLKLRWEALQATTLALACLLLTFAIVESVQIVTHSASESAARLIIDGLCLSVSLIALWFFYRGRIDVTATVAISIAYAYGLLASISYSPTHPLATVAFVLTITLTALLYGSQRVVVAAAIVSVTTTIIYILNSSIGQTQINFYDGIIYLSAVGMVSVVAWSTSHQLENKLTQLKSINRDLIHQADVASRQLNKAEDHNAKLQQQNYTTLCNFAYIGQNLALAMHELANHVTDLGLEIGNDASPELRQAINSVHKTTKHLQALIRPAELKIFRPYDVLRVAIKNFQKANSQNSVAIELRGTTSAKRALIRGQPLLLIEILSVLIKNSLQAISDSGATTGDIMVALEYNPTQRLNIYVSDSGPGFDADQKRTLFRNMQSTKLNGHGFGLYLSEQILSQHFNGTIILDDRSGRTTFIISIPSVA